MSACTVDRPTSSPQSEKCPVDHSKLSQSAEPDKCPVDQKARSTWGGLLASISSAASSSSAASLGTASAPNTAVTDGLPTEREVSSIPRADGEHWVYPSQAQFFAALARKQHTPRESDMPVVVPIHNAVNERAWGEVLGWERGCGGEVCGGVRLVSFKGRPGDMSPRARWKTLLGYQAPFDRHDWTVDRCGTRVRYIIDFYTGRASGTGAGGAGNLAFYLDVRPAFDNWEGVKMRATRFWERWVGSTSSSMGTKTPVPTQAKPTSS